MPGEALTDYLRERSVAFERLRHSPVSTAHEVAAAAHAPGRTFAKVVIVRADRRMLMLALPASDRVNLWRVCELTGALDVQLASERECADAFADCDPGAMPPFGNLYGVPVFVDESLAASERIAFRAGSRSESISMRYADFDRLVRPGIGRFAVPPRRPSREAAAA